MFGENKPKKESVPQEELAQVKMTEQLDQMSGILNQLLQAVKDLNTYKAAGVRRSFTIPPGDSKNFSPMGAEAVVVISNTPSPSVTIATAVTAYSFQFQASVQVVPTAGGADITLTNNGTSSVTLTCHGTTLQEALIWQDVLDTTRSSNSVDSVNFTVQETASQLPNMPCSEVTIKAAAANTVDVLIGNSKNQYLPLSPGENIPIPIVNANLIYAVASTTGQVLHILARG